jgi:hypothetical protein
MKQPSPSSARLGSTLAVLALAAATASAKPLITVNTYDAANSINGDWSWYGGAVESWDGTQDHTGNGGGSLYIAHDANAGDHIYCAESFSGNQWNSGTTYDLTLYTNMTIWIKWDTNYSTMPISAFNANGGLGINLNDDAGGTYGSWSGANAHGLPSQQIPNTASNGWVLLNFPISSTIANIDLIGAFEFNVYHSVPWSGNVGFWVDDITFQPAAADIVPPPTVKNPVKSVPGLNVFASTEGSLYDRQSARLKQQSGLSWVGQATAANPVTYSFTIDGFPQAPATYGAESYLFLIPNPVYNDNAPDWNETNVVQAYIQQGATSATLYFQYKVNDAYNNAMYGGGNNGGIYYTNKPGSWDGVTPNYYESGNLASLTTPGSAVGTWTIKFTSDTNVTLISPSGSTTNFVFPAYNVGYFAETQSPGFNVYLGMQANNAATINQSVDYSFFAISNTASPFSDDFAADTSLDTTNIWDTSTSAGPNGVVLAPATGAYWVQWSLPATGFSLQTGSSLTSLGSWTSPSLYSPVPLLGAKAQLVDSTEIQPGPDAFFNMVKRTATQLQVLLPGESNAPGTPTGKTGTPTAESVGGYFNVTVNTVDSTYHIVSTSDSVSLTSATDPSTLPATASLIGGTAQVPFYFDTAGSQTVTAADTTNTGITSGVSSSVTAQ